MKYNRFRPITRVSRIKFVTICAIASALLFTGSPQAQSPKLTRAEFFSHTNDDNKDKDTGVYVYVTTKDGRTALAQIENADNSNRDATEYNDGSDHTINLTIISPGSTKADCAGFKVTVKSKANGNDKWKFNAKVTLFFDDGTNILATKDGIELNSRGSNFAEDSFAAQ